MTKIDYRQATFLISAAHSKQFPADEGKEVAFVGRSNSGKSSALNTLTDHKNLARTSKTPGRTQLINFFTLDTEHRLVDLPGYGFAKAPIEAQKKWISVINHYLKHRESLAGIILLMDIRHPFMDFDTKMIEWSQEQNIPLHILLSKADKLAFGKQKAAYLQVKKEIGDNPLVTVQLFSSLKKIGLDDLKKQMGIWFS